MLSEQSREATTLQLMRPAAAKTRPGRAVRREKGFKLRTHSRWQGADAPRLNGASRAARTREQPPTRPEFPHTPGSFVFLFIVVHPASPVSRSGFFVSYRP